MNFYNGAFHTGLARTGRRLRLRRTALWCLLLALFIGHGHGADAEGSLMTVYTSAECRYGSCDDVNESCVLFNSRSKEGKMTLPDFPFNAPGWLITYEEDGHNLQIAYNWKDQAAKYRVSHFGEYLEWQDMAANKTDLMEGSPTFLPGCDLNTVIGQNRFYLIVDSEAYVNLPDESLKDGFLQVQHSGGWTLQTFYHLTDSRIWKRSFRESEVMEPGWALCCRDDIVYQVTQNINRDSIYNTYVIPTNPTVTVDGNGWLQAVDDESTAEDEATDMTGAIMFMLKSQGYCHLSPGTFYVSGNIDLPVGATLEGCGNNTVIRLLSSVKSGYIARILQNNTVRGIRFSGGKSKPRNLTTEGLDLGAQNGIVFTGNADGNEENRPTAITNIVTDCWFENFDGSGFYGHNTGGNMSNSVTMSDCFVNQCRIGINIDYFMEYSKFSDCIITNCYYACVNNGGNNVFTGCTFHGVVGWMCDNTAGDKRNNMHGSCVGCTFNHIDNANRGDILGMGSAVIILNSNNGYVFTGCQFWYGNIIIDNSKAITFSDCLFGNQNPVISVTGDHYGAIFHGNTFFNRPTLNVNPKTVMVDCYTAEGEPVEP